MFPDREVLQKNAQKLLAAGKVPAAIDEYLKILRDYNSDWNLMIQVGDLYLKIGQSAAALPHFQRVAEHYCAEGFFLKAVALYKRIHRLDPGSMNTRIQLAEIYFRQGQITEARFELLATIDHHEKIGHRKEIIRLLQKLIEYTPEDIEARIELAGAYEKENLLSEALGQYLEISVYLLRAGKPEESLSILQNARRLNPRNPAVLWKILCILLEQGRFEEAGEVMGKFSDLHPDEPEKLALIVKSFSQPGQERSMLEMIERALQVTPRQEALRVLKGELLLRHSEVDEAYVEFVKAVEEMLQRNEHIRAIALLRRLTRHDPSFYPAWELLLDLYMQQGMDSNLSAAYSSLADAYIGRAMHQDALKCLEKLQDLDPRNKSHREKLEQVRQEISEAERRAHARSIPDFDLEIPIESDEL